jgi:alpha,alpha-trehalase
METRARRSACGYPAARLLKYGSRDLDAANLMMPIKELLPPDDPRIRNTIDRTIQRLTDNDLVYRYRTDDGLRGEEGAFALMSFWLADALAFSGRLEEAHHYFEAVLNKANHLGLFSEQIDPRSGELLGNFPQVLSHTGLLDTALHLAYVEQPEKLIKPPTGSQEHRREVGRA